MKIFKMYNFITDCKKSIRSQYNLCPQNNFVYIYLKTLKIRTEIHEREFTSGYIKVTFF
jgi:hypothetical protein